jgi:phage N-6-adenine-methyltransferase
MNPGMFTSKTDLWSTPQKFFDVLDAEFDFEVDVCATAENAKCPAYYTVEQDGLSFPWSQRCWMNPPYGREISKWVRKAHDDSRMYHSLIVCLLPARTDTAWWQRAAAIRFVRGRLKFGESTNSAPFPSAVVIFDGRNT